MGCVNNMEELIKTKNRTNFMQIINDILAFCIIILSVFPPLQAVKYNEILSLIVIALWILVTFITKTEFYINLSFYKFMVLFFILYTFFIPYLTNNGVIGNRYLSISKMFIFYLIHQYNNKYGRTKSNIKLIIWLLPFVLFTTIKTLVGLTQNPYLSRLIKSKGDLTIDLLSQGIGGYSLIYFLVMVSIPLFFIIVNKRLLGLNKWETTLCFGLLMLFTITIIYSNYFIALVLLILSFLLIIASKLNRSFLFLIILAGFMLTWLGSKNITLGFLYHIFKYLLNKGKTVERLELLLYGRNDKFALFYERFQTLRESYEAFVKYPLTGIVVTKIETNEEGYLVGFGQHSYILDTLALFGLFIGLINIILIMQPFIARIRRKCMLNSLNITILVVFSLLMFINIVTPSIGCAVFFIYPAIYDLILYRMEKGKRSTELSSG